MEPAWKSPGYVEFFQQVRLLERVAWSAGPADGRSGDREFAAIGEGGDFADEPIHFRAANSVAYPHSPIEDIHRRSTDRAHPAWLVDVAFMGLIGPMGVLPPHVTTWLLGSGEAARPSLRDFLALFEHRFISRFYRAWEVSRILFGFERSIRQNGDENAHGFSLAIRSLTGFGDPALSRRLSFSDRLPVFYAGLFSNLVRPAENLQKIVEATFHVPCAIVEFVAEWQTIDPTQRSRLGSGNGLARPLNGANNRLGSTACLGNRVWTVQDRFRVQLGPLDYPTFCRFLPAGDLFVLLRDLLRLYVGTELAFDIQPILQADAVPPSRLGSPPHATTRLGWNAWLVSRPFPQPATDAIFAGSA
jgi:type VI secretion system protein ImpH